MKTLAQKITLINQVMLEALSSENVKSIVKKFSDVGTKTLGATFAFTWIKNGQANIFELAFKSPSIRWKPLPPRENGSSFRVMANKSRCLLKIYRIILLSGPMQNLI